MIHSQGKNETLCVSEVTAPGSNMPFHAANGFWEGGGAPNTERERALTKYEEAQMRATSV